MPRLSFRPSHKRRLKELEDQKQPKGVFAAGGHSHPQSDITNLVTDLAGKQATLVSATNIKTVNGYTLLGAGNLVISSGSSPWDFDEGTASTTYSVGTIDFEEGAA